MTENTFNSLPIGSTVNLINFPQLEGTMTGKNGYMAIVDFPANNITHSDPEPRPIHYANLGVVGIIKLPDPFKEEVNLLLTKWALYSQTLFDEIAQFQTKWGL